MDRHDIERNARAQREISEEVAPGIFITLRTPTRNEIQLAGLRARVHRDDDAAAVAVMQRSLLQNAVVAWNQQLRLSHLLPVLPAGEQDGPQLYEPGLVPVLLDAQPDWAARLALRLTQAIADSDRRRDSASGN